MSTFGLKMIPLQRKVSGSKRNRHEFSFQNVDHLDVSDLHATPTKRQKTPRSGSEVGEHRRELGDRSYGMDVPTAARNLSLEDDPAFHDDLPTELESPRFDTPQQEAMYYRNFPLNDDILASVRSAPTPGRAMNFDFHYDRRYDDIEESFRTMRGNRSGAAGGGEYLRALTLLGPERVRRSEGSGRILEGVQNRSEAESYNRRLARELHQNLPERSYFQYPPKASQRGSRRSSARGSEPGSARSSQPSSGVSSQRSSTPSSARRPSARFGRCVPVPQTTPASKKSSSAEAQGSPAQPRKRKLCRHFLKGFCKQGDNCNFLHDASIFSPDTHKVFLGGLPANTTSEGLVKELARHGYRVTNRPQVLRGFCPKVCMESAAVVNDLVNKGRITLWGGRVDVRPYQDKKPDSESRRSVFLGGLADNTTAHDIRKALASVGAKLKNTPVLKSGFAPQVLVGSAEQAQKLVQIKRVLCAGKMIDIGPFVDLRPRKRH